MVLYSRTDRIYSGVLRYQKADAPDRDPGIQTGEGDAYGAPCSRSCVSDRFNPVVPDCKREEISEVAESRKGQFYRGRRRGVI